MRTELFPILLVAITAVATATQVKNGRAASTLCSLCVDFVRDVEDAIKQDIPDIEKKADQICDEITLGNGQLDAYCKNLVKKELDTIVQLLKAGGTPETVCQKIHFCRS
ncbi:hypothetical protein AAVH_07232 [Aphelenchoides avenae]|nr:hypothetical protein AAVH_07232 [Aphelenchus avenae]